MNLPDQLKALRDNTKSPEVKSICESALSDLKNGKAVNETSILESVKNIEDMGTSINEINPLETLRTQELERSKAAANRLMESWGGLDKYKSKTAGSYSDGKQEDSKEEVGNISESISAVAGNDKSANAFIESQKVNNLGLYESILSIKEKGIYEHPNVKILCEKYSHLIKESGYPEFLVAEGFAYDFSNFLWDDTIKSIHTKISESINTLKPEIAVSKALYSIEKSSGSDFYSPVIETLNNWLVAENKSVALLSKELTRWSFNPVVRELVNSLSLMENNNEKLSIPINPGNSAVNRLFSPVLVTGGKTVFTIGNNIFEGDAESVHRLKRAEFDALPEDFRKLLDAFYSPFVKVNEQNLSIYVGDKSFRIVEENDTIKLYSKNVLLATGDKGKLANQIALEISGSYGINETKVVSDIITIFDNYEKIVELDFAKRIVSKVFEGASINLIKWAGKIYLNRINEGMNENSIFSVNGTQATKMVKEFLKYDISEGLTQFLEGESKVKSIMIHDRSQVINNIAIIEAEINKLKNVMDSNPVYADSKEMERSYDLLERELKILRNKWRSINEEIEKIENGEIEDINLNEDEKFTVGDYVKIKESGNTGKVISIDSSSGSYTVLMDNGRTGDFRVDEIVDIEEALSNAEETKESPEESRDDSEKVDNTDDSPEDIKEGANPDQNLSKAPGTSKLGATDKKPAATMKSSTTKAPESKEQDKPGKKDVTDLKDANLEEAPEGKVKETKFDIPLKNSTLDKVGYNVSEEEADTDSRDSLAVAPTDGDSELSEAGLKKNDSDMAEAPGGSHDATYKNKYMKVTSKSPEVMDTDQQLASAPGDDKGKELNYKVDKEMGYNVDESDLKKQDSNLAKAPGGEKEITYPVKTVKGDSKNPEIEKTDQQLAEAPDKGAEGDLNIKVNPEMGYNIKESEESKKN